jgi:FkbM family methyltransferase
LLSVKTLSEKAPATAASSALGDPRRRAGKPASSFEALRRLRLEKCLQPAKISCAIKRRRFMRVVPRSVELDQRVPVEYLGSDYSGWAIPADRVRSDWVIYCLGAGNEVSFETELIRRTGCEVHSFDPTDASAEHVNGLKNDRLHFYQYAIWNYDGMLPMYVAEARGNPTLSGANLPRTRVTVERPCRTIDSIMRELGHERIDLLKYHVEGGEYEVFDPDDLRRWKVQVLIMGLFWTASPKRALSLVDDIVKRGYRPVAAKSQSFTFMDEDLLEQGAGNDQL